MARRAAQSGQALYAAEGGIEWAKAHLQVRPELRSGSVPFGSGQAEIVITLCEGGYKVTSEGRSGLAVRKIEQILALNDGKWTMKSYQELHR